MMFGCQSMVGKIESILLKHPRDAFVSPEHLRRHWQAFGYTSCPNFEKAMTEYEAFAAIVAREVADCHFIEGQPEDGLDAIYTHDPVKITKRGAILLSPGKALRRKEVSSTRAALEHIGIPILGALSADARMEGGDVVWLDEGTVALGRGYRTNDEGIRQFREIAHGLDLDSVVVPMPHAGGADECLHLMSIISLVDTDLAVVYSKYMPVFFRELLLDRGISLIEVPDDEYENLGCNVLALAPRVCLMMDGNPVTQAALQRVGATVITYRGEEISFKGTGGPTCLTAPLWRR